MTLPDAPRLMAATEATWPAFSKRKCGPFTLREGRGAGRRASAASAEGPVTRNQIDAAADAMRAMGQRPVFVVPDGDRALDAVLDESGWTVEAESLFLAAAAADIAALDMPRIGGLPIWPPLAIIEEIWAGTEIDAARRAVIEAVALPKTAILTRAAEKPAGALFIAADGDVAMPHAVVTRPALRGRGAARFGLIAAARWAMAQGCTHIGLAVMAGNTPALNLYKGVGMMRVGGYHYRVLPAGTR